MIMRYTSYNNDELMSHLYKANQKIHGRFPIHFLNGASVPQGTNFQGKFHEESNTYQMHLSFPAKEDGHGVSLCYVANDGSLEPFLAKIRLQGEHPDSFVVPKGAIQYAAKSFGEVVASVNNKKDINDIRDDFFLSYAKLCGIETLLEYPKGDFIDETAKQIETELLLRGRADVDSRQIAMNLEKELPVMQRLILRGMQYGDFDRHESDLYVKATPESISFFQKEYDFPENISFFHGSDKKQWIDVPFAASEEMKLTENHSATLHIKLYSGINPDEKTQELLNDFIEALVKNAKIMENDTAGLGICCRAFLGRADASEDSIKALKDNNGDFYLIDKNGKLGKKDLEAPTKRAMYAYMKYHAALASNGNKESMERLKPKNVAYFIQNVSPLSCWLMRDKGLQERSQIFMDYQKEIRNGVFKAFLANQKKDCAR